MTNKKVLFWHTNQFIQIFIDHWTEGIYEVQGNRLNPTSEGSTKNSTC